MAGLLEGKVAVVTGAGKGLGRAIAERYAKEGATVVASDLTADLAKDTASALGTDPVGCDVTSEEQVKALFDGVVAQHGRVDIAVANAGVGHVQPLVGMSYEEWRRTTAVNLDGVFLTYVTAGAHMAQQGSGVLVGVASITSMKGSPLIGPYAAAKAGVVNLTKTIATELRDAGVRANAICPAFIDTDLVLEAKPAFEEALGVPDFTAVIEQKQGRYGTPEEVANLATWLASDRSRWCTATAYVLDGGFTASLL